MVHICRFVVVYLSVRMRISLDTKHAVNYSILFAACARSVSQHACHSLFFMSFTMSHLITHYLPASHSLYLVVSLTISPSVSLTIFQQSHSLLSACCSVPLAQAPCSRLLVSYWKTIRNLQVPLRTEVFLEVVPEVPEVVVSGCVVRCCWDALDR